MRLFVKKSINLWLPISFFYNIILMFQTLPDQSHCYFLSDHDSLNGYVVKKIPFSHPAQVPRILATLKKQAVFNSILSSCIRTSGIQGNFEILISIKVHIFWEGHKILRNLYLTFNCHYKGQKKGEDYANFSGLLKIYEL